jgi:hypothetical protein
MSSAHKFEKLGIDTGAKSIEALPIVEGHSRPLVKLVASSSENDPE